MQRIIEWNDIRNTPLPESAEVIIQTTAGLLHTGIAVDGKVLDFGREYAAEKIAYWAYSFSAKASPETRGEDAIGKMLVDDFGFKMMSESRYARCFSRTEPDGDILYVHFYPEGKASIMRREKVDDKVVDYRRVDLWQGKTDELSISGGVLRTRCEIVEIGML